MSETPTQVVPTGTAYKTPLSDQPMLSLLGLQIVKPLVSAEEASEQLCVYEAIQAPGGFIPLHSHPEVEWLYVLEGVLQVLAYRDAGPYWFDVTAGESVVIPSSARHALHNTGPVPMRLLCFSQGSIGRFFEEVGRPVAPEASPPAFTLEWQQEFLAAAARRGYWSGSREANAAIGLPV